jgi:YidC/Oxa1 family membrane protein insertase
MDNLRLILIFALAFIGLLIYQAWMEDYGSVIEPASSVQSSHGGEAPAPAVTSGVPEVAVTPQLADQKNPSLPGVVAESASDTEIVVETDLLKLVISTRGGTLRSVLLLDYLVSPEDPEVKVELLHTKGNALYIGQSGLIGG